MATEKEDDTFKTNINEVSQRKAREELNERNHEDRKVAVQTLREWVLQQDWLKTPTDFAFLLRFLRVRKFSQLEARQTLENYWTNKARRPDWHKDLDYADPLLQEILRAKTYYSPEKYDKDGCRWIFSPFERITVQRNMTKMAVVGYFHHLKSAPVRMKAFYLYNEPAFFNMLYATFSVLTRQKILDRIHMVGKNLTKLYEKIDMSVMPDDYLPDDYEGPSAGSEAQIVEDMIADMMSPKFRNYIREVTSSKYGLDLSKKLKCSEEPVAASFRKLNI